MNLPTINSPWTIKIYSAMQQDVATVVLVWVWERYCMHPGTQEPWLLGSACTSSCWRDSRPLIWGGRWDLHHHIPSPALIIINTHSSPQPLPIPPLAFWGVWWLWPLLSCPSLGGGREEERGRKREAAAHHHHVPRGPLPACMPASPAAQYSCGSAPDSDQLGSQPSQRAKRRVTVWESSSPLFTCSSLGEP